MTKEHYNSKNGKETLSPEGILEISKAVAETYEATAQQNINTIAQAALVQGVGLLYSLDTTTAVQKQ